MTISKRATSEADLSDVDHAALTKAIEAVRAKGGDRREQIESKLRGEHGCTWLDTALFASYSAQCDALDLFPGTFPPCWIEGPDDVAADPDNRASFRLLQGMLAAGVSRFDPDPLAALRNAKAKTNDPLRLSRGASEASH
jgi:hypothetical protein